MFYKTTLRDHIRVPPNLFNLSTEMAVIQRLNKKYEGFISKDFGIAIAVPKIIKIGEGIIIAGDGAAFYETEFELLTFKPELQEVLVGRIRDIAEFGAFMTLGPVEGMIHISQTMDDFVSFSKDKVLIGKDSRRSLKVGDRCLARIVAISYKDITNPKLGLTMRQQGLGKPEWSLEEEKKTMAKKETAKK